MNQCQYCGTVGQQGAAGCYICNQRNHYQGQQYYNYPSHYQQNQPGSLGYQMQYDQYSTVLNQILASLLRLEEKLNEKKD
jgi:hypothetical protein